MSKTRENGAVCTEEKKAEKNMSGAVLNKIKSAAVKLRNIGHGIRDNMREMSKSPVRRAAFSVAAFSHFVFLVTAFAPVAAAAFEKAELDSISQSAENSQEAGSDLSNQSANSSQLAIVDSSGQNTNDASAAEFDPNNQTTVEYIMAPRIYAAVIATADEAPASAKAAKTNDTYVVATLDQIPRDGWLFPAPKDKAVTSPFTLDSSVLQEQRKVKGDTTKGKHAGIDIGGSFKVLCAREGIVEKVVRYGKNGQFETPCEVTIRHEENGVVFWSRYLHMVSGSIPASIDVGTYVVAGTILGTSGDTGYSFGAHLHFEIGITPEGSKSAKKKLNVNPKPSSGVKYNGKYNSKANQNEIAKYATINYSFDANEVNQINAFRRGCNRSFIPGLYCASKCTTRIYPATDAPKGISLANNQIVIAVAEGYNTYKNRWIAVKEIGSNDIYYIYESYVKRATSSMIAKPVLKSATSTGALSITVNVKSAPAKGCVHVAVIKKGNIVKELKFTGTTCTYKFKSAEYGKWTVTVYTKVDCSEYSLNGPSSNSVSVDVKKK